MRQGHCSTYRNPEVARIRSELAEAIKVIECHVGTAKATQLMKMAIQAGDAASNLREAITPYASYELHLADATYQAAGIAAEGLEGAMEAVNDRFCVEGRWHAGALPAYQSMLEASLACRAIRSRRIGLQDQIRRISNDVFEYVEE